MKTKQTTGQTPVQTKRRTVDPSMTKMTKKNDIPHVLKVMLAQREWSYDD